MFESKKVMLYGGIRGITSNKTGKRYQMISLVEIVDGRFVLVELMVDDMMDKSKLDTININDKVEILLYITVDKYISVKIVDINKVK